MKNYSRVKERETRQHKARIDRLFDSVAIQRNGYKATGFVPEADLKPLNGEWWGDWRYNKRTGVLEYYTEDGRWRYEVDLERCNSGIDVFHWICHMTEKTWLTKEQMGFLVHALYDILYKKLKFWS